MLVWEAPFERTLDQRVALVSDEMCVSYTALGTPTSERLPHSQILKIFEKSMSYHPNDHVAAKQRRASETCSPSFRTSANAFLVDVAGARAMRAVQEYLVHYQFLATTT